MTDLLAAPDSLATAWSPPRSWFEETPDWLDPTWTSGFIQIDDDTGRVAALVAPYKECILDGSGDCWTAPPSPTNYEFAHVGAVRCAEGDIVRVANVGGGVGHFDPTLATAMSPAVYHYENTASRVMVGRYHDRADLGGIVFLGSMWPEASPADRVLARASALSGDWRWVDSLSTYDMAGSQLVNNPGFRPSRYRDPATFAIVASVGPGAVDVMRGLWQPSPAPPAIELAERITMLEDVLAAVLVRMVVDDEPVEVEDVAECEKWIPWYDDDGHRRIAPLDHSPMSYDIPPPAHVAASLKSKLKRKADKRPSPLSSPKEIVGKHGHKPHGPSIRWPALYEHLKAKGMTKRKAAMISNGMWRKKHGLPPKSVPGTKGKVKVAPS